PFSWWPQVSSDFTAQGFFRLNTASREVARQQSGVMRVNCIDCLDRTNVVQGVLARKVGASKGQGLG
ncbi:SAC domain-containing protein, partial [Haematococcus lacustris]